MTIPLIYSYDSQGYFTNSKPARENPLIEDSYLLPAFATFEVVIAFQSGKKRKWDGEDWIYEDIIVPDPPTTAELLVIAKTDKKKEIELQREIAIYSNISITTINDGVKLFSSYLAISGQIALSIANLQKRIDNSENDPRIKYPAKDNSQPLLTLADFQAIEDVLIARNDYYNQGIDLKASVDAAIDIATVDAIVIAFT